MNDLSHSMVHYLLAIHKIKEAKGSVRATDLVNELGLTKGTVSIMLGNLRKKMWIEEEKDSKNVDLSELGHDKVHQILSSRALMFYFLKDFIGVTEEVAEEDSCQIEHLLSSETSEKFFNFMKEVSIKNNIKSSLDLSKYKTVDDFINHQKADFRQKEERK